MSFNTNRLKQAKILRFCRKVHRISGIVLCLFIVLLSISGLLLGWKKHSNGYLLAKSQKGISTNLKDWLPLDSLHTKALHYLHTQIPHVEEIHISRIDVQPQKGMIKFIAEKHFWGVQIDATTGHLLQIERRRADFLERIHDGSILGTVSKLIYTSLMGISMLVFCLTGFWLWLGPKRMRKNK